MKKLIKDIASLTLGELIIILATVLVAGLLHLLDVVAFKYTFVTGAVLGATVTIVNYIFLVKSVDRAINNYMALRGDKEMDEEEAERFSQENSAPIQNAIKISYIIRTFSMVAALLVAFLTDWFHPLTTAIPLLAFRPLLSVIEFVKGKIKK